MDSSQTDFTHSSDKQMPFMIQIGSCVNYIGIVYLITYLWYRNGCQIASFDKCGFEFSPGHSAIQLTVTVVRNWLVIVYFLILFSRNNMDMPWYDLEEC